VGTLRYIREFCGHKLPIRQKIYKLVVKDIPGREW
jgi:hypothetical protein